MRFCEKTILMYKVYREPRVRLDVVVINDVTFSRVPAGIFPTALLSSPCNAPEQFSRKANYIQTGRQIPNIVIVGCLVI